MEDFEVVNQLIISIKNILKSNRYYIGSVLDKIDPIRNDTDRSYRRFTDSYYVNIDKALESIVRVKKIIERM